ncbi:Oligoribonuclease NrnB [Moorella thermoacetica]|uniref:Oligoribonuclease NrnB n=1 Tax=Neomoorella thermoacetica TaxID=1525 RepID=A0AAC9HIX8_NEOTH|nr:DHHA1 domain-containing protein [Moorella thermoacetica]AOQ24611.1 Oligoribonuclease NrnB [Moorella thermoacetica]TYL12712.1 Oligoribonuclease NrnB [Moorella thermoacetica]
MILITHNDLDGIGCAVLALAINPETKVYICTYDDVNKVVANVFSEKDELFITDLSVNQETAEKLKTRGQVTLLDHHKTAAWLNQYPWAQVDTSYCGTKLFYNYLISHNANIKPYEDFVMLVNDYDLWLHKDPRSRQLNRLLQIVGDYGFISRFVTKPEINFAPVEQFLLDLEEEKIQNYCQNTVVYQLVDQEDNKYIFAFAERYTSELAEYLLKKYKDYAYVMLANLNSIHPKISLRSRGDFDVSAIAKQHGGGGHKAAAGFSVDPKLLFSTILELRGN